MFNGYFDVAFAGEDLQRTATWGEWTSAPAIGIRRASGNRG